MCKTTVLMLCIYEYYLLIPWHTGKWIEKIKNLVQIYLRYGPLACLGRNIHVFLSISRSSNVYVLYCWEILLLCARDIVFDRKSKETSKETSITFRKRHFVGKSFVLPVNSQHRHNALLPIIMSAPKHPSNQPLYSVDSISKTSEILYSHASKLFSTFL